MKASDMKKKAEAEMDKVKDKSKDAAHDIEMKAHEMKGRAEQKMHDMKKK